MMIRTLVFLMTPLGSWMSPVGPGMYNTLPYLPDTAINEVTYIRNSSSHLPSAQVYNSVQYNGV